ncbi:hypothetical protein HDU84_006611 [Entophlyctis sp. JEL0112]|nr:hypothetical protein HDU84_006611 [Entophlyctis sp. JEL0112]
MKIQVREFCESRCENWVYHMQTDFTMAVDDSSHHSGNSVAEAIYHIMQVILVAQFDEIECVIAGSGVLQLPYALSQAGWVGVTLVLFAAFANFYSGTLLVKCLYSKGVSGERRLKGFAHIGQEAFGRIGKIVVEFFMDASLMGGPIVYLILTGMNLEYLFGTFSMKIWHVPMVLSAVLVLIPFLAFKTLKEIAILSAFGVFATVLVIVTVVFYAFHDLSANSGTVSHKVVDFTQFASALGSVSFSYSGNFIVSSLMLFVKHSLMVSEYPEVEASMAEPHKFRMVLSLSMVIISVMYLITAILGYAAYGNLTESPILNNLPKGLVSNFSVFVITAHVLFAIPVLITTFALDVERRVGIVKMAKGDAKKEEMYRKALRCVVMIVIVAFALAIPFFKDFMTLLGAVANTVGGVSVVVLVTLKVFQPKGPDFCVSEKAFGVFIMLVGLFGGVVGGYEAVVTLINDVNGVPNTRKGGH